MGVLKAEIKMKAEDDDVTSLSIGLQMLLRDYADKEGAKLDWKISCSEWDNKPKKEEQWEE